MAQHPFLLSLAALTPEQRATALALASQKGIDVDALGILSSSSFAVEDGSEKSYPLSSGQTRLWFLQQLLQGSSHHNQRMCFRVSGNFNALTFVEAVRNVATRHEILRTLYVLTDTGPRQVVEKVPRPLLVQETHEREDDALAAFRVVAEQPFDLAREHSLRLYIAQLPNASHVIGFVFHHIATDHLGNSAFMSDLMEAYRAMLSGEDPGWESLAVQYKDFAAWEQRTAGSSQRAAALAFWKQHLAGNAPLDLPRDVFPAVATTSGAFRAAYHRFRFPEAALSRLFAWGAEHGLSPYNVLLPAFLILLHRYTRQQQFVLGSEFGARAFPELEPLVGFFVTALPLNLSIDPQESFLDVALRTKDIVLSALQHADVSYEQIIKAVSPERDMTRNTLYQVLLNVVHNEQSFALPSASVERIPIPHGNIEVELDLEIELHGGRAEPFFVYSADHFAPETIARMADNLCAIVEEVAARATTPMSALRAMSTRELTLVQDVYPAGAEVGLREEFSSCDRIQMRALNIPHKVALLAGEEQYTYEQVEREISRYAAFFQASGVGEGDLAALCFKRSPSMILAILGLWRCGAAYIPMEPDFPPQRIAEILQESGAAFLLTRTGDDSNVPAVAHVQMLNIGDADAIPEGRIALSPRGPASLDFLAFIIFTSGSTGRPKGTMIEHWGMLNNMEAKIADYGLSERDVIAQTASPCFDISVWQFFVGLMIGGRVVVCDDGIRRDPELLLRTIDEHGITVLEIVPSFLIMVIEHLEANPAARAMVKTLRVLSVCGEEVKATLLKRWYSMFPETTAINAYGPAEASDDVSHFVMRQAPEGAVVPIGRPIPNFRLYVVDEQGNPSPIGVPGELWVSGRGVSQGYVNNPEQTAKCFGSDPFVAEGAAQRRLYRTGDLAYWQPDGNLVFVGRADFQVKIRGVRVEPGEIEQRLLLIAGVQDVVVVAKTGDDGRKFLAAYIVCEERLSMQDVRRTLTNTLPEYMVPAYFVRMESLPLTANDKVDRKCLPDPRIGAEEQQTAYAEPRNGVERALASVWTEVLKLPRVGIDDNYFGLGGDSILAITVLATLREHKLCFPLAKIFTHPTIRLLASATEPTGNILHDVPVQGSAPASPLACWFFAQDFAEPSLWSQSSLVALPTPTDTGALRSAIKTLLVQHDVLRSHFVRSTDGLLQQDIGELSVEPGYLNFAVEFPKNPAEWPTFLAQYAEQVERCIDVATGRWLACGHLRSPQRELLYIAVHHLVVDGVSWSILLNDLRAAYEHIVAGGEISTLALPGRTSSVLAWNRYIESLRPQLTQQKDRSFWMHHAAGPEERIGRLTPQRRLCSGYTQTILSFDVDTSTALLRAALPSTRVQAQELLLASLSLSLGEVFGPSKVGIMLESHGRRDIPDDMDLSRTVGWFTAEYPVLLPAQSNHGLAEHLVTVKDSLRFVPNGGIGYGFLRNALEQEGKTPDVLFNYYGNAKLAGATTDSWNELSLDLLPPIGKANHTPYALEIVGSINAGLLRFRCLHIATEIEVQQLHALGIAWRRTLRALCESCIAGEAIYAASDVSLVPIDHREFQSFLNRSREWIAPGSIEKLYPMTSAQAGILYHCLARPSDETYVELYRYELEGVMDAGSFRDAVDWVFARHGILRAAFVHEGFGRPQHVELKDRRGECTVVDASGLDEEKLEALIAELQTKERLRGFDFQRDPLLRLCLVRCSPRKGVLLWTSNHMLLDGWSVGIVMKEILFAIDAYSRGITPSLPPCPSFSDYVLWRERQSLDDSRGFWRNQLTGAQFQTFTVTDGLLRSSVARVLLSKQLSVTLTARIEQYARRLCVPLNAVCQGILRVALASIVGKDDIVSGYVVSGRPADQPGMEAVAGMFVATVPLRFVLGKAELFEAMVQRLAEALLQVDQHHLLPLPDIAACTDSRDAGDMFDHLIAYQSFPLDEAGSTPLQNIALKGVSTLERTNYPCDLLLTPGETLSFKVRFDTGYLHRATVEKLIEAFAHVAETIVADPQCTVAMLCPTAFERRPKLDGEISPNDAGESVARLATEAEIRQIAAWNATEREFPSEQCLWDLFVQTIERYGTRPALRWDRGSLTFADLNRAANGVAELLLSRGIRPGDVVAISARRSPEIMAALFGILKARAVYLPIDPDFPLERQQFLVDDGEARLFLMQKGQAAPALVGVEVIGLDIDILRQSGAIVPVNGEPEDPCYLLYTSGSTGKPKGVLVRQRGVVNRLTWMIDAYGYGPHDAFILKTPITFDVSVAELFTFCLCGASLVIPDLGAEKDPREISDCIRTHGVTISHFVPSMFGMWLRYLEDTPSACAFKALRLVCASGEALPPHQVEAFFRLFPAKRLLNLYGPTEATVEVTAFECRAGLALPAIPIGYPIANTQMYVLTPDLSPVGIGELGEICIGGIQVAGAYWKRPELSAEKFVDNPFLPGTKLYRTGDLGCFSDDGAIIYKGRLDHQVKIRGIRVELGEIQQVLCSHPLVRDAYVHLRTAPNGDEVLVAYVVLSHDCVDEDCRELTPYLGEYLPAYMIPAKLLKLDAIPLLPSGKIQGSALPDPFVLSAQQARSAPLVAEEVGLLGAVLLQYRLVLAQRNLHADSDFFASGGHSLTAMRLASNLSQALGKDIGVALVMANRTPRSLSRALVALDEHAEHWPQQSELQGYPVTSAQKRLYFLSHLSQTERAYSVDFCYELPEGTTAEDLRRACAELCSRHDALRARLSLDAAGNVVQSVASRESGIVLPVSEVQIGGESLAVALGAISQPLSHDQFPLVRLLFIGRASAPPVLLLTVHHAIFDGRSLDVFLTELATLLAGEKLQPLAISYQQALHYVAQRREKSHGERDRAFWLAVYASPPPPLQLPTDYPRSEVHSLAGERTQIVLDRETSNGIDELAVSCGASPFMVLLALYGFLLGRWSGVRDVVVGVPVSGRPHEALQGHIGSFAETLALRVYVSEKDSVRSLIETVRDHCIMAYQHQLFPLEDLSDALQKQHGGSPVALFNTMLSYTDRRMQGSPPTGFVSHSADVPVGAVPFELIIEMFREDSGLELQLSFQTALFKTETIQRFAEHFEILCRTAVAEADTALQRCSFLSEQESYAIEGFRTVAAPWASSLRCIHEDIAAVAKQYPALPCIVDDGVPLTYGELLSRSTSLAGGLIVSGIAPGDCVVVLLPRGTLLTVALIGILKSGAYAVPLDPAMPAVRLQNQLEEIRPALLIGMPLAFSSLPVSLRTATFDSIIALWSPEVSTRFPTMDLTAAAYGISTSGSTGTPKVSVNTHRGLANLSAWSCTSFGIRRGTVCAQYSSVGFDAVLWETFAALRVGATLLVIPESIRLDPAALATFFSERAIEVAFLPTPVAEAFFVQPPPKHLRVLLTGGDTLRVAPALPYRVVNNYGPSECAVVATSGDVNAAEGKKPDIGRPIPGVCVNIVDPTGNLTPIGVFGELQIGGASVGSGYIGRPSETRQRFVEGDGSPVYRTGDMARWLPDGRIEFRGRVDGQIKVGGVRVELADIECQLRRLPSIADAACIVIEGTGGDARVIAFIVSSELDASQDLSAEEAMRQALSPFLGEALLPSRIMVIARLPLTSNGKIDRQALARLAHAAMQSERSYADGSVYEEPLQTILSLYRKALSRPELGPDDNFYANGGNSLAALRVATTLSDSLRMEVSVTSVMTRETPRKLALGLSPHVAEPTASPQAAERSFPLTSAQRRLLFFSHLRDMEDAYNIPICFALAEHISFEAIRKAFTCLVERHEALRSRFIQCETRHPRQIIEQPFIPVIENIAADDAAIELVLAQQVRSFAPDAFPRFRLLVARAKDKRYLLWTIHHTIFDGHSFDIALSELGDLFDGKNLAPLQATYSQALSSLDHREQTAQHEDAKRFWLATYATLPPKSPFPVESFVREKAAETPAQVSRRFDASQMQRLDALAVEHNATPFIMLSALYGFVLGRMKGVQDLAMGTPVSGRTMQASLPHIGCFAETMALRLRWREDMTLGEFLQEWREHCLTAYQHQRFPLESIVEALKLPRSSNACPLFDTMISYEDHRAGSAMPRGLREIHIPVSQGALPFDIVTTFTHSQEALDVVVQYRSPLFVKDGIENLVDAFFSLLESCSATPDALLRSLLPHRIAGDVIRDASPRLATPAEIEQIARWNDTEDVSLPRCTLWELFAEQAGRTPDATALVWERGSLSFADLARAANAVAHILLSQGVRSGDLVALHAYKRPEFIASLFGVMKIGAAYIPIDPMYPLERQQFQLEDSAARVLLTSDGFTEGVPQQQSAGDLVFQGTRIALSLERLLDCSEIVPEMPYRGRADDVCYVMYTSGSTGTPKGVIVKHVSVVNRIACMAKAFAFSPSDVFIHNTSAAFDASLWELYSFVFCGGSLVLPPQQVALNPEMLGGALVRYGVTLLDIGPSLLAPLLRWASTFEEERSRLCLRIVDVGGEILSPSLVSRFFEVLPTTRLFTDYGPTETTLTVTTCECLRGNAESRISIGRPVANTTVHILDEQLRQVGIGEQGELFIGGIQVAEGYLNRPALTAQKFIEDPFSVASEAGGRRSRLYRTGDFAAYRPDGNIDFYGRRDRQVKVGGVRIELDEIEHALSRQPGVQAAAVAMKKGRNDVDHLVGYVIRGQDAANLSEDNLLTAMTAALPRALVPHAIVFLDSFPNLPNGKTNYALLPEPAWHTPRGEAGEDDMYADPSTPLGFVLTAFSHVLRTPIRSPRASFFAEGGSSLAAIEVLAILRQRYRVAMEDIFAAPDARALAETLEANPWPLDERVKRAIETLRARDAERKAYRDKPALHNGVGAHAEIHESQSWRRSEKRRYDSILLTGGTGYLGPYLIRELLGQGHSSIVALVRASDDTAAVERLRESWRWAFGDAAFPSESRLRAFAGDIEAPDFGRDSQSQICVDIDALVHGAALTKHYGPVELFQRANVDATKNLLALLEKSSKSPDVYYLSTTSIADALSQQRPFAHSDESTGAASAHESHHNHYLASKMAAEREVLQAPQVSVRCSLRLGNLVFAAETGRFQRNPDANAWFSVLKSFASVGPMPNVSRDDYTFVDAAARAIAMIVGSISPQCQVLHIINPREYDTHDILEQGDPKQLLIKRCNWREFGSHLKRALDTPLQRAGSADTTTGSLSHILTFLDDRAMADVSGSRDIESHATQALLRDLGFTWPDLSRTAVATFLETELLR